MWFECRCGQRIKDISDGHYYKAHYIPDKNWFPFWDAIDNAVEKSGSTPNEKEAACMGLRKRRDSKTMYQCFNCGRIYLMDRNNEFISFVPEIQETSTTLLDSEI